MAVKLRLRRMGKKRQPIYKVVAADARSPRDGRFIEAIGLYNPKTNPSTIEINEERALYWLNVGAQPTTTVKNILSKQGILLKKELEKKGLSEEEVNGKLEDWKNEKESKLTEKEKKQTAKKEEAKKAEPKVEAKEEQKEESKEAAPEEAPEEPKEKAVEEPKAETTPDSKENSDSSAPEDQGTASDESKKE